jgi:crotonobetainyl-CoA:carnitine CoA-transferase CaiB-like acyl-CoA transferase
MNSPLAGIRVLEAASFISGPSASRLLGDLGAEVIKIEKPGEGDPLRAWGGGLYSPWFIAHNCGKRSLTLRLGTLGANEILGRLIPQMDVLLENFRPGVADRIGIGYERMRALAPRLVYCSISGAGGSGPYVARPFFDTVGQSLSGLLGLLMSSTDPRPLGPALADTVTGLFAAYGVLAALQERHRTGNGQRVETSVLEACLSLLAEPFSVVMNSGLVPDGASRRQAAQVYVLPCADGRLLALHLSSAAKYWRALLRAIGRDDLDRDPRFATRSDRIRNYEQIRAELLLIFSSRDRAQWIEALVVADVPCAPVHGLVDALSDPQVLHLDPIRSAEHPREGPVRWIANPLHFETTPRAPAGDGRPPPRLGEDTDAVLASLGYHPDEIDLFRRADVI